MTQIMMIQSISSLLFIILEVPSWYFADLFGRKKSLVITWISSVLAMFTFAMWTSFYHFLIANILRAVTWSFISWVDSAILYDTLKSLDKEKDYKMIWDIVFYYAIWCTCATILDRYIAKIDYRYTFYASISLMIALIPLARSLQEPNYKQSTKTVKEEISLSFFFAFLLQFGRWFASVIISDYINTLTNSNIRATILSVQSLLGKMFYAILTPIIGRIIDIYDLPTALIFSWGFILLSWIILIIFKPKK